MPTVESPSREQSAGQATSQVTEAEALAYWQEQLAGMPTRLELPADFPRASRGVAEVAGLSAALPQALAARLHDLSRAQNLSLETLLLTAFAALLARYAQQPDLIVLVWQESDHNSPLPTHLLPVGIRVSQDREFTALLGTTQEMLREASARGPLPLSTAARLAQQVSVPGDSSAALGTPGILFGFTETGAETAESSDDDGIALLNALAPLNPEIGLFVQARASQVTSEGANEEASVAALALRLIYDAGRFTEERMRRLLDRLEALLQAVVQVPELPVSRLPLVLPDERHRLLVEWNDTAAPYPHEHCIHQLFEAQVERTPEAVALVSRDEQLTYAQLNARANQLARYLREQGVGPDTLVGLCLERSAEMVIGLLGILKAGGAYLPLDLVYPKDRLAMMLDDARALLLLTHSRISDQLPTTEARVVCLDREWDSVASFSVDNLATSVNGDHLAYVIYTSGSTGRPKGVQIMHKSLVNLLWDMKSRLEITERDVLVAVTTISFDIAALELDVPLIAGAKVVVTPRDTVSDGNALAAWISDVHGTIMQATPATWRMLTDVGWQGRDGFKIACGGEPLPPQLAASLMRGGSPVWNVYGPTETTIWSTAVKLNSSDRISIGRPISNTTVYILDEQMEVVPVGVIGQLYIGGEGVARGYLNRPELTAERFVPDPFSKRPGARMYHTGDLARWLPDGNIDFLGRMDYQVKIRGFRIELGEIETVLSSHPEVHQAVVVARDNSQGDKRLVAFIVPTAFVDERSPGALEADLRALAAARLPDYMVPAQFVRLDALPLTPNGKVDRKALPAPEPGATQQKRERRPTPPRTNLEIELIHLWENAFGITPIGIDDDFFEMGGHSLLAGRLLTALAQTLGKDLPLASFVEAPTIRQQAALLQRTHTSTNQWRSLVALKPGGDRPPLFGIHAAQGTVLFYRHLARYLSPEQPFYGLQQQGLNGKRTSLTRVEDMAAHYLKEIRTIQPQGPYHLIGYCDGGTIAFEMAQQLHEQGETVGLLAAINAAPPDYDFSQDAPVPAERPETPETPEATALTASAMPSPTRLQRLVSRVGLSGLGGRLRYYRWLAKVRWRRGIARAALALGLTIPQEYRRAYASRVNERAMKQYQLRPYPGRMLVIRGSGLFRDPTTGWRDRARGGLALHEIEGHYTLLADIMAEPHVQTLAQILAYELGRERIVERH